MAFEKLTLKVKGVTPLMMHNIRLANPLDPATKAIKKISGKRKKTDQDHEEMMRLEFLGSLYRDETGKNYVIPARAWDAVIVEAAKKSKRGPAARSGVYVEHDTVVKAAGPTDPEARFASGEDCVSVRAVRVQSARTMRCRPIFRDWSTTLEVHYDPALVDAAELRAWLDLAGTQIGILEYRPACRGRFGMFEVS